MPAGWGGLWGPGGGCGRDGGSQSAEWILLAVTSQGKSVRESPTWGQDPGAASVTPWVGRRCRLPLLKDGKLRLRGVTFSEIPH